MYFKKYQKSKNKKLNFFVAVLLSVTDKNAGSGAGFGSFSQGTDPPESVPKCHGSTILLSTKEEFSFSKLSF
jgi:hypothetical protein